MVTRRQRPTSDALRRGPLSPCGYAGARADRARPNDGGLSAVAMNGRCVGRIAVATRAPWPSLTYRRRIRSARRSPIHKPLTFGTSDRPIAPRPLPATTEAYARPMMMPLPSLLPSAGHKRINKYNRGHSGSRRCVLATT